MPPVKAVLPSTMSNLRWLRRLTVATRQGVSREAGQKSGVRNFGGPQTPRDGRPGISRAGGIHQHADLNAARNGAGKSGDKFLSGSIVVENIGAEGNRFFGALNGLEHGGEGGVAVDEGLDFVTDGEGAFGNALDDGGKGLQMVGLQLGQFEDLPTGIERCHYPQRHGTAANPVHAERQVKNRARAGAGTRSAPAREWRRGNHACGAARAVKRAERQENRPRRRCAARIGKFYQARSCAFSVIGNGERRKGGKAREIHSRARAFFSV